MATLILKLQALAGILAIVLIAGLAACGYISHDTAVNVGLFLAAHGIVSNQALAKAGIAEHVEEHHDVNPPRSSGTAGRASVGALVSIAVILALASALVGCVSQEARDNATALDRSARNLAAALAQDPGASKGERAEAEAIVESADANCGYLSAPTATSTIVR